MGDGMEKWRTDLRVRLRFDKNRAGYDAEDYLCPTLGEWKLRLCATKENEGW